ncbi:MAG: TonB-dependent receptor [Bacteroidales bacterium]|nr:TonB-dependent receptor [Candidatus Equibacterium intestinale]
MKKFRLMVAVLLLVCSASVAYAQNILVKGTVTDAATGEALAFVSVQVKGTMTGTTSDPDGNYSITVPENATLVFSFVGYKTADIPVAGKGKVDCALEVDAEYLDDVFVVAYGTAKKESFTGSASTIRSEQLEKRTVANVTKAIDGLAAGVQTTSGSGQPGAGVSVQIRGIGSLNASTSPLYVVDGIPYDGELNAINPNDIETMTVIKDASAGALYGSRGANGVVIITTKKGTENTLDVNFKAQVGVASRAIPRYNTLDAYGWTEDLYGQYRREYIAEGYDKYTAGVAAADDLSYAVFKKGEKYSPFTVSGDQLFDHETGKIVSDAKLKWNDDWLDECTAKAPVRQEYQFGVSGGNSRSKYMFSLNYLNEDGLVKFTNFERISGRANVDSQINAWFKTGFDVNFAQTTTNMTSSGTSSDSNTYFSNVFYTCQLMGPIFPMYVYDADGKPVFDENGNKQYDWGEDRPEGASAGWNPLANLKEDINSTTMDNLSSRAFVDLGGLKTGALAGLKFSVNFGFDYVAEKYRNYYNPYHGDATSVKGRSAIEDGRTLSYTFNQLLSYNRSFGDHNVDFLAGHEAYSYNYQNLYAQKAGFGFGGLYELAPATTLEDGTSYTHNFRIESYLSRLNYDYADKYYFSASYRRDGSSRFNKDYRWGNFWSVGASWRISQEDFMSNVDWVNNLTLKASYGVQGNDNLDSYYAWQAFYDYGYANGANPGAVVTSLETKDLTWEKNENLNIGIESRLFGKLSASVEYYKRYTRDMLMEYPMAVSLGFAGYNKNIGNMQNHGVEITLSGDIINTSNTRWTMTWMGSTTANKVLNLAENNEIIKDNYIIREGEPVYSFYLPESAGVDPATGDKLYWVWNKADMDGDNYVKNEAGNIVDAKGNECNAEDEEGNPVYRYISASQEKALGCKRICGNRIPALYGSWSNEFQFGNFDCSLMTTYSIGGQLYDGVYRNLLYSTYFGQAGHVDRQKAWQQPGDITGIPRIDRDGIYDLNLTDDELTSASYFAIKNVTVGYTFPTKMLKAINFKAIRLSLTADNLYVFAARKGLDPQYNFTGGTGYTYTPSRTVSLGVDLKF